MRAIIVDDEQSARMTLRAILSEYFPEVIVLGEADSPGEAAQLIKKLNPDIVFLDIQMQTGTGFDLLEAFEQRTFQLIFISAHKQHAFDSFRYNAADYILKPVRIRDLRSALEKAKENLKLVVEEGRAMLRQLANEQFRLQLIIPELDGFSLVRLVDIIRCDSSRNYTNFYLVDDKQVVASKTMKDFEDLLIPHGFFRIHKSHVINLSHLARYIKGRGGDVVMNDGTKLPVSRERREPLLEVFIKGS